MFGPSAKELERLVRSERRQRFQETFLSSIADRLPPETMALMKAANSASGIRR
ncbi:hypothetical protein [Mesorhizobium sp.]|uniref:hypothetical protein n=1 Tax=Mesorhizobium sp. TaxID=1871066 RepID=UPI0025BC4EAA|nr:hypothetical protein [Mesorhizobium sp.]